jgi:hypothetical protein
MSFLNLLKSIMRFLNISLVGLLKSCSTCEIITALNYYRVTLFVQQKNRPDLTLKIAEVTNIPQGMQFSIDSFPTIQRILKNNKRKGVMIFLEFKLDFSIGGGISYPQLVY